MGVLSQSRLAAAIAISVVVVLLACEPEATDGLFGPQETRSTDSGVRSDGASEAEVDFVDMDGIWAMAVDLSTCVSIVDVEEIRSYSLLRVKVEQQGLALVETHDVCQLISTPILGLETVVPERVFSLPNPTVVHSTLFGSEPGDSYDGGLKYSLWGIHMEDPVSEPFPGPGQEDDRIFDADEDGNPGVSLRVGGNLCDLYVIQRDLSTFRGILQADGSILGRSASRVEQTTLGASSGICAQDYVTQANEQYGVSRLVRVDSRGIDLDSDNDGEVTCDEIVDGQGAIIEWTPVDMSRCE